MARPPLVLIRGGADRVMPEESLKARFEKDPVPYGQLLEIARRRALYAAMTAQVFDAVVGSACDPRLRRRRG
jgi:hypothetical protein